MHRFRSIVTTALLLVACASPHRAAPPLLNNRIAGETTVHDIDWANRSYFSHDEDGGFYDVRNSKFERGNRDDDNYVYVNVDAPAFGEVTGDHNDKALVRVVVNTGGTGWFTSVEVFAMHGGAPYILDTIPGGDRGDGGIVSAAVVDGNIAIIRNQSQEGDGACCPSMEVHEIWTWNGKDFVEDVAKRRSQPKTKDQ